MKNILLLLFISYFIISCSSNTKTPFEEEAYKMLKTEISDTFSSVGNDVDILNTSTEYYTDSLCVIKLSVKGKNELGGKTSNVFEYIYLKEDDSSTMGFLREIQKNDSSLFCAHNSKMLQSKTAWRILELCAQNFRSSRVGKRKIYPNGIGRMKTVKILTYPISCY